MPRDLANSVISRAVSDEATTLPRRGRGASHAARLPVTGITRREAVLAWPARTWMMRRSRSTAAVAEAIHGRGVLLGGHLAAIEAIRAKNSYS